MRYLEGSVTVTGPEEAFVHAAMLADSLKDRLFRGPANGPDVIASLLDLAGFEPDSIESIVDEDGLRYEAHYDTVVLEDTEVILEYLASCGLGVEGELRVKDDFSYHFFSRDNALVTEGMIRVSESELDRLLRIEEQFNKVSY